MSAAMYVDFGPLVVRVATESPEDPVFDILTRWLSVGRSSVEGTPDIEFILKADGAASPMAAGARVDVGPASRVGNVLTLWDQKAWEASLVEGAHGLQRWEYARRDGIMLRVARRVPTLLFRLLHVLYFSPDEVRASVFLYRHLIPVVQVGLLRRDATFVHASALGHVSGTGLLISGWGGTGKSTSGWMLAESPTRVWSYLSDDLAIVDASGRIHYCPLPVNLFPYSVRGLGPTQKRLQSAMGGLNRLQWVVRRKILGERGVARRLPPPPIRGPESHRLALAINLVRSSNPRPRTEEVNSGRLARACASVMTYEMRHSLPMITAAAAFPSLERLALPPLHETGLAIEKVLGAAFAGIRTVSLSVPRSLPPDNLGQLVGSLWEPEGRE